MPVPTLPTELLLSIFHLALPPPVGAFLPRRLEMLTAFGLVCKDWYGVVRVELSKRVLLPTAVGTNEPDHLDAFFAKRTSAIAVGVHLKCETGRMSAPTTAPRPSSGSSSSMMQPVLDLLSERMPRLEELALWFRSDLLALMRTTLPATEVQEPIMALASLTIAPLNVSRGPAHLLDSVFSLASALDSLNLFIPNTWPVAAVRTKLLLGWCAERGTTLRVEPVEDNTREDNREKVLKLCHRGSGL
ncbi:hypothetical protein JCM6882_008397 [Rhodosporidiobolus microsporus]